MFGVGMGPSKQENQQYDNLSGASSWASNQGQKDITQSTDFMSAILSGDPTKIGQVLGPQIRAIQGQGQQQKQTAAQFGNRGGGTNASMQRIGDTTRSSIQDMISSLTGASVSGLNSTGQNLFGAGQSGFGQAFNEGKTMADQRSSQINDIFKSITSIGAAPFTGGASLGMGNLSMPGGGHGIDSASWGDLMKGGAVPRSTLDMSSLFAG